MEKVELVTKCYQLKLKKERKLWLAVEENLKNKLSNGSKQQIIAKNDNKAYLYCHLRQKMKIRS